jgi:hypothetical protein
VTTNSQVCKYVERWIDDLRSDCVEETLETARRRVVMESPRVGLCP